jgi:hypothetical protein
MVHESCIACMTNHGDEARELLCGLIEAHYNVIQRTSMPKDDLIFAMKG